MKPGIDSLRYLVSVRMHMSPPPTNSKEVGHILNGLRNLGKVEFFKVERDKSNCAVYGQELFVVFNPSRKDAFGSIEITKEIENLNDINSVEDEVTLLASQKKIVDNISSIVALPRYSYIENDERYLNGEIEIPFKHRLVKDGLKYDNRYTIPSCTVYNPFAHIRPAENEKNFNYNFLRANIRHNFQKFHKFDPITIKIGLSPLTRWILPKPKKSIPFTGFI